jgi:hypothetical protein
MFGEGALQGTVLAIGLEQHRAASWPSDLGCWRDELGCLEGRPGGIWRPGHTPDQLGAAARVLMAAFIPLPPVPSGCGGAVAAPEEAFKGLRVDMGLLIQVGLLWNGGSGMLGEWSMVHPCFACLVGLPGLTAPLLSWESK